MESTIRKERNKQIHTKLQLKAHFGYARSPRKAPVCHDDGGSSAWPAAMDAAMGKTQRMAVHSEQDTLRFQQQIIQQWFGHGQ